MQGGSFVKLSVKLIMLQGGHKMDSSLERTGNQASTC